jgi:predicted DNA-binding transcriptional regulator AlpA
MTTNVKPTQPHATKLAFSRVETAQVLGVSAPTIDRLVKRGQLKPSRATRRPLFPVWEIERFLRETTFAVEVA